MTVTAQHSNGMSLDWHLDGASLSGGTDGTVSVGKNLAKGDHHLEVTVSKDGATKNIRWDFTVEQVPVSALLSQVSEVEILKTTTDLVNFGTRYLNTPGNKAAGSYLCGRLAALPNMEVAYHSARFNNVIGTLPSADPSSDVVYVTGADYDSTAYDTNIAPGATDNASGVAIVLELARIMSHYKFAHTVIFGLWNGEEVPPGGSEDFAYDAYNSSLNIGLYVNLDSSSYDPDNLFVLDIMHDDNTTWVADMMTANNSLYNLGLTLTYNQNKCNSDYVPFRRYGYPAVMTHEEDAWTRRHLGRYGRQGLNPVCRQEWTALFVSSRPTGGGAMTTSRVLKGAGMIRDSDAYWFRSMRIDNLSFPEFLSKVDEGIERGSYVCFVEASSVVLANRDQELMTALNDSFMSLPDGMPLVWFARLLGSRKMVRMPGPEVFRDFVENRGEYRQFLVGDTPERIRAVIDKATEVNPACSISGYSPPFRRELSDKDNTAIIDRIRAEAPDIIWVALGLVKQAKWMHKMAPRLDRGIMMGVGAALVLYRRDSDPAVDNAEGWTALGVQNGGQTSKLLHEHDPSTDRIHRHTSPLKSFERACDDAAAELRVTGVCVVRTGLLPFHVRCANMKVALITGITRQDGATLSEFLFSRW